MLPYILLYSPGKKYLKNEIRLEKIKKPLNNFWGPCQVLNMYLYNPITLNGYIYSPGKKLKKIEIFLKSQVQLISRQSILKQGFQKTHCLMVL